MINLTKDILIIKSGEDLERCIKNAITKAKECICKELFNTTYISPDRITSSTRNKYYNASILRLFEDHLSGTNAPAYDETWIRNAHACSRKTPEASLAKEVITKSAHDWLNKSSLQRLTRDCLLILHFLWQEKAVLLPADMKKPIIGDSEENSNFFEFAASSYTEVLALVSAPFVPHVTYDNIPDITTVMNPSAVRNFEWYAWRLIRCSNWHRIEDIDPDDISKMVEHILQTKKGKTGWFAYPIAPGAFWGYVQQLYPERCKGGVISKPIKNVMHGNRKSLESGEFFYPPEHKNVVDAWLNYQGKFVALLKSRGQKTYKETEKCYSILNTYLFDTYPAATGMPPPHPRELNREHIEGVGFDGLLSFLRKGRSPSTLKHLLYKFDALFNYIAVHASANSDLTGFVNPISDIDYPVVKRRSGSSKPAFGSEHFPYLLQYCYAIESFGTFLAERVHDDQINLYDPKYRADIDAGYWHQSHKIIQTEKYGYVPIAFYRNPSFDASQPKSKSNRLMSYEALRLLPRFTIPMMDHTCSDSGMTVHYPQLNYIRHNVVALETGIRSMHIRWLDKRTYGMHVDRSIRLAPLCKLRVNTDKCNDAWDATVSKNVIEVLDRQREMLTWFNDPALDDEVWYDHHEESPFGKIVTLFPKGGEPGVLHPGSYARYFRRLVYSFDLFCRFQLGIDPTNMMPEALDDYETIDDPFDYLSAIGFERVACKLIEHTPHSCRVSVVSEYIRVLPPHIIGEFITGQATEQHVMYYAKVDPAYLKSVAQYQKMSVENAWLVERPAMSTIKAEDVTSKLQQAFRKDVHASLIDFGAISFDREHNDEVLSGIKSAKQRPIDSLAFMPTHICPFGGVCTSDVIRDLGAVPGSVMPCGGCYYSIKTVDHLPRIHGHIRVLTDECSELEVHIAESKKNGASPESLVPTANRRKFLASEIISWSVTAHCLEQMYNDIKTRSTFLIQKPEIVSEHLQRLDLTDQVLTNLIARTAEAKTHAEYFTPQLRQQIMVARNKLLAFTGDFNRMLQDAPTGFTLIDEFRGLIRSACEALGLSLHDLGEAMSKPMTLERPNAVLRLVSNPGSVPA
ncbi:MAG: hypothetical protein L0G37_01840 [Pseudomonas sp.]|nr:hypothetical protein [Pseudomonas sp.]MDN5419746.1 hypothetical protein [Pseudomonadales bacterium]MDN5429919.1 hypothetical protein [Pseudomonadales bacterium]